MRQAPQRASNQTALIVLQPAQHRRQGDRVLLQKRQRRRRRLVGQLDHADNVFVIVAQRQTHHALGSQERHQLLVGQRAVALAIVRWWPGREAAADERFVQRILHRADDAGVRVEMHHAR